MTSTILTLDRLYQELSDDFTVDDTDLGKEAVKSGSLFVKYIKYYSDEKLRIDLLQNKKKELYQRKYNYYSGNGTPEEYKEKPFNLKLKTVASIEKHIETDPEFIKINEQILVQTQKVEIIQECLKELKQRTYYIKTALEHLKFLNGY